MSRAELREKTWTALAWADELIDRGRPDEALAHVRAIERELRRSQHPEIDELRSLVLAAKARVSAERDAWLRTIAERNARFTIREAAALGARAEDHGGLPRAA